VHLSPKIAHQTESPKATEQEQYSAAAVAAAAVAVTLTKNIRKKYHQEHHQEILEGRAHILGKMALERETKKHSRVSTFLSCSCSFKLALSLTERVSEVSVYK
jgi:hypothetical protein